MYMLPLYHPGLATDAVSNDKLGTGRGARYEKKGLLSEDSSQALMPKSPPPSTQNLGAVYGVLWRIALCRQKRQQTHWHCLDHWMHERSAAVQQS